MIFVETNRGFGWAVEHVYYNGGLADDKVLQLRKAGIPARVRIPR